MKAADAFDLACSFAIDSRVPSMWCQIINEFSLVFCVIRAV